MSIYRIEHLTKRYENGVLANQDLSLSIQTGEVFGLLGPNGAGKTTLVRQMVNLLRPTTGRIWLKGQDIAQDPGLVPATVSYLPQVPYALHDLTVAQAVYFAGHLRGLGRARARAACDELLTEWDLSPIRHQVVRRLSGGQRRLVGLAAALIGGRPVLILDEPTSELDPAYRRLVWEKLLRCNAEQGTTIILVTHNIYEAETVVQRVGVMRQGRLIAIERPGRLKAQIDQRVRLELTFQPGIDGGNLLSAWGECQLTGPQRWTLLVSAQGLEETIPQILSAVGLDKVEDFRIQTATLEDVYLKLQQGEGSATSLPVKDRGVVSSR